MTPLEDDAHLSRRVFLAGSAGVAASSAVSTTALAQEDDENGENDDETGDENGENGEDENGDENGENGEDENGEDDENGTGNGATETVAVVDNEYQPDSLAIEPGTTVQWVWEGNNHNINPTEQPEESDWEGHLPLEDEGFEYEYTFEVEGSYEYVCDPHVGVGMVATIEVGEGVGDAADGPIDVVPDAAWTILIAAVAGMVSTLSLVYFFMRYGGEYEE